MPSLFSPPKPDLPPFKTLLVKGKFHPLSPLFLCLSSLTEDISSRALIVTPSRDRLVEDLRKLDDSSLEKDPTLSHLLTRVQLYYPPSPAHLAFLLSMLQVPSFSEDREGLWIDSKAVLAAVPTIVVLHELSSYFQDDPSSNWTLSSYLSLVAHGISFVSQFCRGRRYICSRPLFALFDSQLDNLRLPVLKQLHCPDGRDQKNTYKREAVSIFVEAYFDWIAVFDEGPQDSPTNDRETKIQRLKLYQSSLPGVMHEAVI